MVHTYTDGDTLIDVKLKVHKKKIKTKKEEQIEEREREKKMMSVREKVSEKNIANTANI